MPEETKVVEQPHSCKIAINAKGQWSGEVKVYAKTIDKAFVEAMDKAEDLAIIIDVKNNSESGGK